MQLIPLRLHRKVYLWHMHTYSSDNDGEALRQFQDMISTRFGGHADMRYGNLALKAAGPHPCAQLEFGEQTHLSCTTCYILSSLRSM